MEDLVLGAKPLMNWNNPEAPLLGGFGFGGDTLNELEQPGGTTRRHPCLEDLGLSLTIDSCSSRERFGGPSLNLVFIVVTCQSILVLVQSI